MATITTAAALVAAFLLLPLLLLWRLSLTPQQNARRMRRRGHSYRTIGRRLGCAHTTARRYCLA
jgi:ABC-type spermidine/putrescine transport system permease subunit II|tara:strand:- start:6 stop:197 length:192 start_codon:yes stop_codon:yes gene_type:complete